MARVSVFYWIACTCWTTFAFRYVEWEDNPERKHVATQILNTKTFTPIPGAFCSLVSYPQTLLRGLIMFTSQNFSLYPSQTPTPFSWATVGKNTTRRSG